MVPLSNSDPNLAQAIRDLWTKLNEMESKFEKRLDSIDKTLVRQEAHLEQHIMRTELAEKNLEMLRQELRHSQQQSQDEIQPIKRHVQLMEMGFKITGILVSVAVAAIGILATVVKLLHYLNII